MLPGLVRESLPQQFGTVLPCLTHPACDCQLLPFGLPEEGEDVVGGRTLVGWEAGAWPQPRQKVANPPLMFCLSPAHNSQPYLLSVLPRTVVLYFFSIKQNLVTFDYCKSMHFDYYKDTRNIDKQGKKLPPFA